jgi:hypothetical protein
MCSAWSFRTDVATALTETFRTTNSSGFTNIVAGGSTAQAAPGASYNVVLSLDNFQARVSASPGFWSATMNATSEISLRVSVSDASGNQVLRTIVDGEGNADASGGCDSGSQAVSEAVAKAVKRAAENYAAKVINSGLMHNQSVTQPMTASNSTPAAAIVAPAPPSAPEGAIFKACTLVNNKVVSATEDQCKAEGRKYDS